MEVIGILAKASQGKKEMVSAQEKENIELAVLNVKIGENDYKELSQSNLQLEIDNIFGKSKALVIDAGNKTFIVSFIENKRDYIITPNGVEKSVNWAEVMTNAIAPENQIEERNKDVIGIGTDGNPVNMDLWEYLKLEDGTYALNNETSLSENGIRTSGYSNNNLQNGKIQGTIPQYIKGKNDREFIPVTNISYLFYNTNLSEAPKIPYTVLNMRGTFNSCQNLTKMPSIPSNVINMYGSFSGCTNLTETCPIPDSVINMGGTFYQCSSLTIAPKISNNAMSMYMTFQACTSLEVAPKIPESVTILCYTFCNCNNLQGTLEINANVTGKQLIPEPPEFLECIDNLNCLSGATTNPGIKLTVTGSCPVLNQIVYDANNSNITTK